MSRNWETLLTRYSAMGLSITREFKSKPGSAPGYTSLEFGKRGSMFRVTRFDFNSQASTMC